ncbi:MAG: hypothetical protein PVI97_08135 [Candidatus Thiodiazotropha sp.]
MLQAAITERSPHSPPYKRHRPEQTLLYHIIERHYPAFRDVMVAQGKDLPLHVQQEFADYLKCGRPELRHKPGNGRSCGPSAEAVDRTPEQLYAVSNSRIGCLVACCPK